MLFKKEHSQASCCVRKISIGNWNNQMFFLYGRALKSITLVKLTSILEIRIETEQKFFIYAI
jgi:hypothetical protein